MARSSGQRGGGLFGTLVPFAEGASPGDIVTGNRPDTLGDILGGSIWRDTGYGGQGVFGMGPAEWMAIAAPLLASGSGDMPLGQAILYGMQGAGQMGDRMEARSDRRRQREQREKLREWLRNGDLGEHFSEDERALLANLPEDAAISAISSRVFDREKMDLPADVDAYQWAVQTGQIPPDTSYLDWQRMGAEATRAPRQQSDYDRKLAYYSNLDIPAMTPEKAQGLALDRYTISRDPVSQQAQVVDRVTGQIVGDNAAGMAPASGPGGQGGGSTPSVSGNVPQESAPDPRAATGLSGFWGNLANWASDLAGFGVPFENVDEAGRALGELKADIITVGSAEVPGRPSDFARRLEGVNTIDAFSLFETPERSLGKLRQTRQSIAEEMRRMEGLLANPSLYNPQQVATTRQNLERMRSLYNRVDVLLAAAGRAGERAGGDTAVEGVVNKYLGPGPGRQ